MLYVPLVCTSLVACPPVCPLVARFFLVHVGTCSLCILPPVRAVVSPPRASAFPRVYGIADTRTIWPFVLMFWHLRTGLLSAALSSGGVYLCSVGERKGGLGATRANPMLSLSPTVCPLLPMLSPEATWGGTSTRPTALSRPSRAHQPRTTRSGECPACPRLSAAFGGLTSRTAPPRAFPPPFAALKPPKSVLCGSEPNVCGTAVRAPLLSTHDVLRCVVC